MSMLGLALCPFFVDRPKMLGIRTGMAQKNSYAAIQFMASFGCVPFCRRQFGAQVPVRVRVRIRVFGPCAFVCGYGVWARIALVSPRSWCSFARCVPCCRSQALMPCIMAGMDPRYLFMVVHTPVVCNDICLWFRLHKTVESPQLQSFLFVVILVVAQMQILMVLHHRVSPAAVH